MTGTRANSESMTCQKHENVARRFFHVYLQNGLEARLEIILRRVCQVVNIHWVHAPSLHRHDRDTPKGTLRQRRLYVRLVSWHIPRKPHHDEFSSQLEKC